ncbi:MAG: hypothetical protein HRU06_07735 [Oceanospirillaceae bacterium]|nr:hypothetical protein [Oceanospirillaceae bacterium]
MQNRRPRLTSGYTLVIHEVTTSSVKVWVGALSPSMVKPEKWRLCLAQVDSFSDEMASEQALVQVDFVKDVWKRPFNALNKRFYHVHTLHDLPATTDFVLRFEVERDGQWHVLETAYFSTLPEQLPTSGKAFTIGLGSCFYAKHDGGRAANAYEALYKNEQLRPDIKFLVGDQVYVDIGLGLYPLSDDDCQDRIADEYVKSWELLRSMLRRGGTWMLADDHEYWNNYPYLKGFNPYLITLGLSDRFKDRWEKAAKMGVDVVQQMQPLRTFNIGSQLSFCVADMRSNRTDQGFMTPVAFEQLIAWVKGLTCPGILVIPQPLIAKNGDDNDSNLPDWPQYEQLLLAMHNGNHDLVVLTGDVHYGQVSQVQIGNSGNKLVEIITSPMSNLSELDGIATAVPPKAYRQKFPFNAIPGIERQKITRSAKVSTQSKWWDLRFPSKRTTEHFMTLDFKPTSKGIMMSVHAWDARNIDRRTKLPKTIAGFKPKPILIK